MSGVLTVALSLRASNVYAQTSIWTGLNVRISLVLPDWDCFEEIRTEKAGLRGEINHTLDAYNGTVAIKEEGRRKKEDCQGWGRQLGGCEGWESRANDLS